MQAGPRRSFPLKCSHFASDASSKVDVPHALEETVATPLNGMWTTAVRSANTSVSRVPRARRTRTSRLTLITVCRRPREQDHVSRVAFISQGARLSLKQAGNIAGSSVGRTSTHQSRVRQAPELFAPLVPSFQAARRRSRLGRWSIPSQRGTSAMHAAVGRSPRLPFRGLRHRQCHNRRVWAAGVLA